MPDLWGSGEFRNLDSCSIEPDRKHQKLHVYNQCDYEPLNVLHGNPIRISTIIEHLSQRRHSEVEDAMTMSSIDK